MADLEYYTHCAHPLNNCQQNGRYLHPGESVHPI